MSQFDERRRVRGELDSQQVLGSEVNSDHVWSSPPEDFSAVG